MLPPCTRRDAWWRGVARGPDAAAEALSELVDHTMLVLVPDGVCQRKGVQVGVGKVAGLGDEVIEMPRFLHLHAARCRAAKRSSIAYVPDVSRKQKGEALRRHMSSPCRTPYRVTMR